MGHQASDPFKGFAGFVFISEGWILKIDLAMASSYDAIMVNLASVVK